MASDAMVVEDGVDEGRPPGEPRSSWVLVAAAFVLGLALGTMASSPPGQEVPAVPSDDSDTLETSVGPITDESESGVSDLVAEFPDALVAVSDGIGSGHEHLLWPVKGALVVRSMSGGSDVHLDRSGQFVAMSSHVPDLEGSVLSVGRFNGIRAVSSGVTSYVWHDARSGHLAFTTEIEGEWLLQRVSGTFQPAMLTTGPADGRSVAAWGDWGFAIQIPDDEILLLNPAGQQRSIVLGEVLTSHESGWLLVEDGGLKLVSAGGGVRNLDLGGIPDPILAAEFSPYGDRVAVVGRFGVQVYDLASEDEVATLPGYPGGWLTWSSDSRFLVAPAQSGIVFHDLETGNSVQTLVGNKIVVAQVRPLSTS